MGGKAGLTEKRSQKSALVELVPKTIGNRANWSFIKSPTGFPLNIGIDPLIHELRSVVFYIECAGKLNDRSRALDRVGGKGGNLRSSRRVLLASLRRNSALLDVIGELLGSFIVVAKAVFSAGIVLDGLLNSRGGITSKRLGCSGTGGSDDGICRSGQRGR